MNTGSKVLVEPSVAKLLDPYSNPRTIPGGWDVSAMVVKKKMSVKKNPAVEPNRPKCWILTAIHARSRGMGCVCHLLAG
jgi:hypothetical protein